MRRHLPLAAGVAVLVGLGWAIAGPLSLGQGDPPPQPPAAPLGFATDAKPFLDAHCAVCHSGASPEGGLDLAGFTVDPPSLRDAGRLLDLRRRVAAAEMPPLTSERPPPEAVERFVAWADVALVAADRALPSDPGRVTVRRLSRFEYGRTLKHLLDLDFEPGQGFPADDLGYGFDNIGDVLSMSPLLLEKYADAAAEIARRAIWLEDPKNPTVRRLEAEGMVSSIGVESVQGDRINLFSPGNVTAFVTLPRDGDYLLRARVFGQQAGSEPARMTFLVDEAPRALLDVPETQAAPGIREERVRLTAGRHQVGAAFTNDYYRPEHPDPAQRDRNLVVDWLEVVGPVDVLAPPASHARLLAKDPGAKSSVKVRAAAVVKDLASRAWRRPATGDEVKRLGALVEGAVGAGQRFEEGLGLALQAVLVSPHFLFRLEPGAATGTGGTSKDLDGHALATRLSYFLWSSLPDEGLSALAARGKLNDPQALEAEARRMLADPRSKALAENFAVQWLELRNLEALAPDPQRFPGFDRLRQPLRREAELLFDAVLREKRDLKELLTARFTFVNGALAAHYGLPAMEGEDLTRVELNDERRGGILALGGVLAVTSNPTRTSPVKRGKWVLENVLDAPPRPPPPGADSLDETAATASAATLREKLELHRQHPDCAACHTRMDALGFALERYDAVGRLREEEGGRPVDTRGLLPDGRAVDGLATLRTALLDDRAFLRCLARKLFTFALGRAPTPRDEVALFALAEGLPRDKPTLEDLILAVVRTEAFRKRRPGQ